MKKKSWLRFLESCAFLVLLAAVLAFVGDVVERKEGRKLFGEFLEDPKAYDVLFVGDSRLMNAMLPMELWADYGVAGYNLACYGNSVPVSYWSLMNALDYAQPKLVVFAVNGVGDERKITGSSGDLHTALDFFPLTRTKTRAIEDLMHDPEFPDARDDAGNLYRDVKWEYYFTLGKYHSRWSELTKDDFKTAYSVKKGGETLVGVMPFGDYEVIDEDQYAEEVGHGYAYLRRTIEECRSRGIELLLVNLPDPGMIRSQMHAHTVGSIAEEYGVDYVDLMWLDSVVDYEVDCYDTQPHMNASGTQKVTAYLGSYIHDRYALPDRRGEARYAHWAQQHDAYVDDKLDKIRAQTELNHVLMLLHDDDFDVRMAVRPDAQLFYDELAPLLMHNMAREHVLAGSEYAMWSNAMYPLEAFDQALWEGLPYYLHKEGGAAREHTGAEAESAALEAFGAAPDADVMIEVIDRRTDKTAVQMRF